MSLVAALKANLTLETAQFEAGANRARRSASSTASSINKSMGSIKAVGSGFLAAFTVGALASGIKASLDYAGSLGELSQQLGVTTRDLQTFRFAAGQVGVDQATLEVGLQKLTITLGKIAAGAAEPAKALNAIGISAKEVAGISTGDAFRKIADGLAKISDRSQRAAVEVALFGKSGAKLDNLLAPGSGALNELARAAEELGIVLSDKQIQQADDTADKLEAVKTVLAANIAGVVAQNASAIVGLASSLAQLTSQIIRFLNSNPQLALGIIGGLIGGRVGGLPGAAVGAIGGLYAGAKMRQSQDANSTDPAYLKERVLSETKILQRYIAANKNGAALNLKPQTEKVNALAAQANKVAAAYKAQGAGPGLPTTNVPQFLAGGGGGSKKGGGKDLAAERERKLKEQMRNDYQFAQDQRRNQMDILRAQEDLAVNIDDRVALQLEILKIDQDGQRAEYEYQVKTGDLTRTQADILIAQQDRKAALEKQAILEQAAAQKRDDEDRLIETRFSIERQQLEAKRDLAHSSAERRSIELQLLDLAYEEKKQQLERIIANKQLTDAVRQRAQVELEALNGQYNLDRQNTMQNTAGPWEQWQTNAMNTQDAMESLKVQGIEGAVDALTHLTEGFKSFRDAAVSALKDVIAQLIRIQMMKMIASLFGGPSGGLGGLSDIGLNLSSSPLMPSGSIGLGSLGSLPPLGFATGGSFNIMGRHGVDRNMLSLNGLPIARVSRGERLSIGTEAGRASSVNAPITFNLSGSPSRETLSQIAAKTRQGISAATRRGM